MAYEVKSSKVGFTGRVCTVTTDVISLPNGKTTERETVIRGNAAAIVAADSEGKLIFVRQYRHAVGKEVLEIPAGMIDEGEDPEVCAIRELEEETSYKAGKMNFVCAMYTAIGFCTEVLYLYIAEDLSQGEFNFDPDEFIEVEKYTLDEALKLIADGEIIDGKTVAGIYAYAHKFGSKN